MTERSFPRWRYDAVLGIAALPPFAVAALAADSMVTLSVNTQLSERRRLVQTSRQTADGYRRFYP